jgi:cupin superfamily acireductone dioxygenase involved in methionine salvage
MDRVRAREREPRQMDAAGFRINLEETRQFRERAEKGKVVITTSDHEMELNPMATVYRYLHNKIFTDTSVNLWRVFANHIKVHTGAHKHQGGLIIFVVEGEGYSIVDGVREDWEAGDLLLLPLKPGGVEHAHFSHDPEKTAKWVAFIYDPIWQALGPTVTLTEDSPAWKAAGKASMVGKEEML